METVYPKLKEFCHELGYQFQASANIVKATDLIIINNSNISKATDLIAPTVQLLLRLLLLLLLLLRLFLPLPIIINLIMGIIITIIVIIITTIVTIPSFWCSHTGCGYEVGCAQ